MKKKSPDVFDLNSLKRYMSRKVGHINAERVVMEAKNRGRFGVFDGHHLYDIIDNGMRGLGLQKTQAVQIMVDYICAVSGFTHYRLIHKKAIRLAAKKIFRHTRR